MITTISVVRKVEVVFGCHGILKGQRVNVCGFLACHGGQKLDWWFFHKKLIGVVWVMNSVVNITTGVVWIPSNWLIADDIQHC